MDDALQAKHDTLLMATLAARDQPAPAGHDVRGRFTAGNPGGPGRPRRATERAYLAALSDAIPLDDWRAIVARAVTDAKAGDPKAREWIAHYVLGPEPMTLLELAVADELQVGDSHVIRAEASYHRKGQFLRNMDYATPLERAHEVKQADDEAAAAELKRAEREVRKAERAARKAVPA